MFYADTFVNIANRIVKNPPVIAVSECQFVQNQTTQLCSNVVFNFFERNGLQYFIQVSYFAQTIFKEALY
jgi:hypothetical protein